MSLRQLAEAATAGPWAWTEEYGVHAPDETGPFPVIAGQIGLTPIAPHPSNGAYIAAASPDVILRILDRAETLLMKLDRDPSDVTMAEVKTFLASLARGEIGVEPTPEAAE